MWLQTARARVADSDLYSRCSDCSSSGFAYPTCSTHCRACLRSIAFVPSPRLRWIALFWLGVVKLLKPSTQTSRGRNNSRSSSSQAVSSDRPIVHRTLWTVMCALGLAAAFVLINKVWTQYSTSPTITSVESTHFPIWNIPFPAVTVCQVNKVHLSAAVALYKEE